MDNFKCKNIDVLPLTREWIEIPAVMGYLNDEYGSPSYEGVD